jgi:hypothetical protein
VLQQELQTSALKQRAQVLYIQLRKDRRQKYNVNMYTTTIHFLEFQNLKLVLEMNMTSRSKSGYSALQINYTAPNFKTTVGDALIM